jgi:hypothetical protein
MYRWTRERGVSFAGPSRRRNMAFRCSVYAGCAPCHEHPGFILDLVEEALSCLGLWPTKYAYIVPSFVSSGKPTGSLAKQACSPVTFDGCNRENADLGFRLTSSSGWRYKPKTGLSFTSFVSMRRFHGCVDNSVKASLALGEVFLVKTVNAYSEIQQDLSNSVEPHE